jgi:stalled ribosome rescue protein Dom34
MHIKSPVYSKLLSLAFHPRFFKMMNDDELRAWYGEEHVFLAAERGAIGTLLISDRLFK